MYAWPEAVIKEFWQRHTVNIASVVACWISFHDSQPTKYLYDLSNATHSIGQNIKSPWCVHCPVSGVYGQDCDVIYRPIFTKFGTQLLRIMSCTSKKVFQQVDQKYQTRMRDHSVDFRLQIDAGVGFSESADRKGSLLLPVGPNQRWRLAAICTRTTITTTRSEAIRSSLSSVYFR